MIKQLFTKIKVQEQSTNLGKGTYVQTALPGYTIHKLPAQNLPGITRRGAYKIYKTT